MADKSDAFAQPLAQAAKRAREKAELTQKELADIYCSSKINIDMTSSQVKATGFSNSSLGNNTVTVTYESYSATFIVEVVEQIAQTTPTPTTTPPRRRLIPPATT